MFRLSATNVCMLCECVVTICEKFVVVFLFLWVVVYLLGALFRQRTPQTDARGKKRKKAGTWRSIQREGEKKSFFFSTDRERDAKNLCSSHSTFSESY